MSIQKTAIYKEKLSSKKTENLFITLMLIFLVFTLWRASSYGLDGTTITCAIFFLFFLFYVLDSTCKCTTSQCRKRGKLR